MKEQVTRNYPPSEEEMALSAGQSTVCWGAIFSGLFTALLVHVGLMCLGLVIGGTNLLRVIEGNVEIASLGVGAALWTIVSALIALYAGGHVSGRVAGLISTRVGRIQGLVVASFFFLLMFTQAGIMVSALGSGVGNVVNTIGAGMSRMTNTQIGSEVIEDALADLNLKSSPETVVKGVAARLMRGNEDSAVTYLSNQAGLTSTEAKERLDNFKNTFLGQVREAGFATGRALRVAGWTLLISILFGGVGAMTAGGLAANYNLRAPVSKADAEALHRNYMQRYAHS